MVPYWVPLPDAQKGCIVTYIEGLSDAYDMIATKYLDIKNPQPDIVDILIAIRDMIDKETDAMDSYYEKIGLDD